MSVHPKAAHLRQPGAIGDKVISVPGEFPDNVDMYVFIVVGDCGVENQSEKQDVLFNIKQSHELVGNNIK
jgi:hypothetical protein